MMLYSNTKVNVHSPDGNTDFFNIVAGVLQGDTLAQYMLIICLDNILRMSIDLIKENGFALKRQRGEDIPQILLQTQTIQMI